MNKKLRLNQITQWNLKYNDLESCGNLPLLIIQQNQITTNIMTIENSISTFQKNLITQTKLLHLSSLKKIWNQSLIRLKLDT